MEIINQTFFNNSIQSYLLALVIFTASSLILKYLIKIIADKIKFLSSKTKTTYDNSIDLVIRDTKIIFVIYSSFYVAINTLKIPQNIHEKLHLVFIITLLVQVGIWINSFLSKFLNNYFQVKRQNDPSSLSAFGLINFIAKFASWLIVLLLILDNLNIDISALIAGLGVGGIAVALAVQNILGDLFASLSIVLDKPFIVGDFIVVGDIMGNVEKIGIKTTRLRSLSGEQLIVANSDLLASRVKNFKRMNERRIAFAIGVTYDTDGEHIQNIPQMIRQIIESKDNVRFDRAHFKDFGNFSLNFEIVYYVLSSDYLEYMNIQERINLGILNKFRELNIEFAFPTQTIHLEK